ncbi:MAG TPA: hypothetical protein VGI19_11505 [Candidatus Cybelea sp.]|jgi:hypothetical protein
MIPAALVGVWAAQAVPAQTRAWVPSTPLRSEAHYFLVISKGTDGRVSQRLCLKGRY